MVFLFQPFSRVRSEKLHNQDFARRSQFANSVVKEMDEADINNAVFRFEATFDLNREENTQIIRCYAEKKLRGEDIKESHLIPAS